MHIKSKTEDYQEKVEFGYRLMKNYRVAICSIVRDCAGCLQSNIPVMNRLMGYFKECHMVVFENDSGDGTKDVLSDWSKTIPHVHVLSEDLDVETFPEAHDDIRPAFSSHRIKLMAGFRNQYLDFIEQAGWGLDYIIMVDLDLAQISVDGIANSFGHSVPWDAMTSYGKKVFETEYIYYDTYAFREDGDDSPQTEEMMDTFQNLLAGLEIGAPLIRVASAFNGLAIYSAESIRGLRYRCEPNRDSHVEVQCEHVTFHQDMRKNGCDRIYLNPSQIVYYDFLPSAGILFLKRMKRRILRLCRADPRDDGCDSQNI